VFDVELAHREITGVAGREAASDRERSGRHETVGLGKGSTAPCELAPPFAGAPTFGSTEWCYAQPFEQRTRGSLFARFEPPNGLLDVDRTDVGSVVRLPQGGQSAQGSGSTSQQVDDDGRVQEDRGQLPETPLV
jgi:hypothetical protein